MHVNYFVTWPLVYKAALPDSVAVYSIITLKMASTIFKAGQSPSLRHRFVHHHFIYDVRFMNNISREEVKLVDCYPEIQRKTLRQQEEDGFWDGQEHAGKEDVLVYTGEGFCCFFKTMPSSQLRQLSI